MRILSGPREVNELGRAGCGWTAGTGSPWRCRPAASAAQSRGKAREGQRVSTKKREGTLHRQRTSRLGETSIRTHPCTRSTPTPPHEQIRTPLHRAHNTSRCARKDQRRRPRVPVPEMMDMGRPGEPFQHASREVHRLDTPIINFHSRQRPHPSGSTPPWKRRG